MHPAAFEKAGETFLLWTFTDSGIIIILSQLKACFTHQKNYNNFSENYMRSFMYQFYGIFIG